MAPFTFLQPESLDEAFSYLAQYGEKAKVMAGGTDLVVAMKEGVIQPDTVVSLSKIANLDFIDYHEKEGLRVGALALIRSLETNPAVRRKFPIISQAAHSLGSVQVRNLATLGGNLCNAAPSADMAPPFICLNAQSRILGPNGERWAALEDFFTGPNQTILQKGEILAEIRIPLPAPRTWGLYLKHSLRRAMDIAIVGVGVVLSLEEDLETCHEVKIALGAVAPVPLRARRAEEVLRGRKMSEELIFKAGELASEDVQPIDDIRSSRWYRREMVRVLVIRAIKKIGSSPN